jgi:hypothetical protein
MARKHKPEEIVAKLREAESGWLRRTSGAVSLIAIRLRLAEMSLTRCELRP